MTKARLDSTPINLPPANDEYTHVGRTTEDSSRPLMMRREAFPDTGVEVFGLTDIEHAKRLWARLLTDGVNTRKRLEKLAKRMNLEGVGRTAPATGKGVEPGMPSHQGDSRERFRLAREGILR